MSTQYAQQHIRQYNELSKRLVNSMPRATFGLADETVIEELKNILTDGKALLEQLPPHEADCDYRLVRILVGETMIHLAHAYEAMHNSEQAIYNYEQASWIFEQMDQRERTKECKDAIEGLNLKEKGTFDAEFERLQHDRSQQTPGSLAFIEVMMAIGALHKEADDLYEAQKEYQLVEEALLKVEPLTEKGASSPALEQLSLEETMTRGQDIDKWFELYFRLCSEMVYLYRDRDSSMVKRYVQRAHEEEAKSIKKYQKIIIQIMKKLIFYVRETLIEVGQGVLPHEQIQQVSQKLTQLSERNASLAEEASRIELIEELEQELQQIARIESIPAMTGLFFDSLQAQVQMLSTYIKVLQRMETIDKHAGKMQILDVQITFDALRAEIQAFARQDCEQQNTVKKELLARTHKLEEECRKLNLLEGVTASLLLRAELWIAMCHYDEAITVLVEAKELLRGRWQHDRGVAILVRFARAYANKQDWEEVSRICQEGIDIVEGHRYSATSQYMQSSYLKERIELYSWGVRAAYETKDYELMLRRAELSKCRSVMRYQQRMLLPPQNGDKREQEFLRVSNQLLEMNRTDVFYEELQQKRRTLWDLLTIQRFKHTSGKDFPDFHLSQVQHTLADDEAVIYYYWLDQRHLLIVTLDQRQVIAELRPIEQEEREELEAFTDFLLKVQTPQRDWKKFTRIQKFAAFILPREGMRLIEGKQRLLLSPHRLLHMLPFHALSQNGSFLIQNFAMSYIPNLTSLLIEYQQPTRARILAIGIKEYEIPGEVVQELSAAEDEVDQVAHIYANIGRVTTLKGKKARNKHLQALKREGVLEEYSCLHFSTHGQNIDSDTPIESGLLLQDTRLDGMTIANWRLQAEIIVLSACCSGQNPIAGRWLKELPGDDLFGLSAAFFCAGVKKILCSLWPVNSPEAYAISTSFHRYLTQGKVPEVALQCALKDFLARAGVENRKINYWASFFLSTVGRPISH